MTNSFTIQKIQFRVLQPPAAATDWTWLNMKSGLPKISETIPRHTVQASKQNMQWCKLELTSFLRDVWSEKALKSTAAVTSHLFQYPSVAGFVFGKVIYNMHVFNEHYFCSTYGCIEHNIQCEKYLFFISKKTRNNWRLRLNKQPVTKSQPYFWTCFVRLNKFKKKTPHTHKLQDYSLKATYQR